ncbi:MAG: efflux RND transporter permease subunit [Planctomycetes bacterium]|nr:efflux RND transporter permease subunit [Planctomycetota bacterium]
MLSALLNGVIRFALQNRAMIAAMAAFLLIYGSWKISQLPIDVFPNLNRPRVVVMTEAPGLAPEEVETLVTFPLETALNGATGVQAVRTSSGVGISVIYVEFDWGTDIYNDRQIVNERIALATERLPEGVRPQLAPISSIMGQIVVAGIYSEPSDETLQFKLNADFATDLNEQTLTNRLYSEFNSNDVYLPESAIVQRQDYGKRWAVEDRESERWFTIVRREEGLEVHRTTSPMQQRTLADWVVRQQLLTIPGVAQVFVMGGERKQFQVLVNPDLLLKYGVTLHEVKLALKSSNQNATGGYLDEQGPNELLVRALGRVGNVTQLEDVVVKHRDGRSVLLGHVAKITEGAQVKRGDSSVVVRAKSGERRVQGQNESGATFDPRTSALRPAAQSVPAVVLTINKQPGADTRQVSHAVNLMFEKLEAGLPSDLRLEPNLYQQKTFIDLAIWNVYEALGFGSILVVLILFIFLLNFRATFITLTAIPLSLVITGLVFKWFDLSINTMTLGGIAVAIGELVDDAIVDVENIFRRLRENRRATSPQPALLVVFRASVEIRNSIVFGTLIVVLAFMPLFAMGGMEGRLFTPLGIAYIVSILSSLVVSLTVTPVLSYWLLRRTALLRDERESVIVQWLKSIAGAVIRGSVRTPQLVLVVAAIAVFVAGIGMWRLESDFLPDFNEGAVQVNVLLPPGTSLHKSNEIATIAGQRLSEVDDLQTLVRKTGRAELDEHAEGVNTTEIIASFDPHSARSREAILADVRARLDDIPGIVIAVEQPLSHLISHMLSGVKAKVAIKLYGDDLETLRRTAAAMEADISDVVGIEDLQVEQQATIPQLRIEIDGHRLKQFGLTRGDVTELIQTAMNGEVVSEVLEGQRTFDLLVRLDESYREDIESVKRLSVQLPTGGTTSLDSIANIYRGGGPNVINREQVRRRIVLQCNVAGRGLVDVVEEIKQRLEPIEQSLPTGYFLEYGGQFKSEQAASRTIAVLFVLSLGGMFMLLYTMFRSVNLALQVMIALPMAFIGSIAALYLTDQTLTIAAKIGFISLCGIASRNGILLINHYLHLVHFEGEEWSTAMIVRAGQERLAPVLMTALTSGIGLLPLALAAGEPGKELLYPVATVIIGGLISSTLLEFLVRPALFWQFGRAAAKSVTDASGEQCELVEES